MIKTKDIVWMAGLLEGEAWFGWKRNRRNDKHKLSSIVISVQMTDRDVVKRVAALWKRPLGGPYRNAKHSEYKATYTTCITATDAASWCMMIYDMMGKRRQTRIRHMLKHWRGQKVIRSGRIATCHQAPYFALDLCKPCYRHKRWIEKGL